MGKLLVEIDREALERVRVKLGAKSEVAALRRLISLHDTGFAGLEFPAGGPLIAVGDLVTQKGEPTRVVIADTSRAKGKVPGKSYFRPNPKPSKK